MVNMDNTAITIIGSALAGGIFQQIYSHFFISRKEKKEYDLQIIELINKDREIMHGELERLREQFNISQSQYEELQREHRELQREHNELRHKHDALKKEITELKKTHPNFMSNL
jgi:chromosome segregation ATPase